MKRYLRRVGCMMLWLGLAAAAMGCDGTFKLGDPFQPGDLPRVYAHDFAVGAGTWIGDTADYSIETGPHDAAVEIRTLPAPFAGIGLYMGGTNRSDDLFVYAKTAVEGLVASEVYRVDIAVEFLTDAPRNCVGVGGAPGESVWIIAGAAAVEPITLYDGSEYRLNIDRGNQAIGGRDAVVLGDIASPDDDCSVSAYATKHLGTSMPSPLTVRADRDGRIWLLVGLDSGYEARSEIFLRTVTATFTRLP
jgi:hypothetical protein